MKARSVEYFDSKQDIDAFVGAFKMRRAAARKDAILWSLPMLLGYAATLFLPATTSALLFPPIFKESLPIQTLASLGLILMLFAAFKVCQAKNINRSWMFLICLPLPIFEVRCLVILLILIAPVYMTMPEPRVRGS